ncbi:MAG TPA: GNAT family N-acetyltransferase [Candidatus Limnocylindria bacterium]
MRIVTATLRDVPALIALMTASPLLRRYRVNRASARRSLLEALRARDTILIATEPGEVVGMAWVILTRALDRAAYLRLLLVAERRQSRGVGAALLERAERRAVAARCRHMLLLVTTDNRRARAFYSRRGYRHVADVPGFVRPRIRESIYLRSLAARR